MARREDEAIAVRPVRITGIETKVPRPKDISQRGGPHRETRMAGLRLLDRIGREEANRVDGPQMEIVCHGKLRSKVRGTKEAIEPPKG
jgi:hypothetical protein